MTPADQPDDELPPYLKDGTTGQDVPQPAPLPAQPAELHAAQPQPSQPAKVVQMPGTVAKKERKATIDFEKLEADYRSNRLSVRELGRLYERSSTRIQQYATERGWKRDVTQQARVLSVSLANGPEPESERENPRVLAEVDQTALAMAGVRREHRAVIKKGRAILIRMLQEVEESAHGQLFLELFQAAQLEVDPEKRFDHLRTAAEKLLTLPSRVYGLHKLSIAAKNLIGLERQAFDLDAPDTGAVPPPRDSSMSAAEVYAWLSQLKPQ